MAAPFKACRFRSVALSALVIVCLSVGACKTRLVYQQLDWLIPWYVDQQLALNARQKTLLQTQVKNSLAWHCQDQVPLYVQTLQSWQLFFSKNYARDDFNRLSTETKRHVRVLGERMLSDTKDLLFSLDAKQQARLYAFIGKNNKEYEEKYLGRGVDLNELHLEESREAAQFWLGSLNKEQDKLLQQRLFSYQNVEADSAMNRQKWLEQFRHILDGERVSDEQKFQQLEILFFSPENHWTADYKKRFDSNADLMVLLIEQMLALSSDKQKKHIIQHFKDWESDFNDIARQCEKIKTNESPQLGSVHG